tara:strand:+ start:296 stop:886 length:591 start_codon:yes stop_codon:yes gene_type:complete
MINVKTLLKQAFTPILALFCFVAPSYGSDRNEDFSREELPRSATTTIQLCLQLPQNSPEGEFWSVNSLVVDSRGIPHNLFVTFTKSSGPLIWYLSLSSPADYEDSISQVSGSQTGKPYKKIPIVFDSEGHLKHFHDGVDDMNAPSFMLPWDDTRSAVAFALNFKSPSEDPEGLELPERNLFLAVFENTSDGIALPF